MNQHPLGRKAHREKRLRSPQEIRVKARIGSASIAGWPFTCPKCKTEQGEMPGPVIDATIIDQEV
jgi:hypothetical protein